MASSSEASRKDVSSIEYWLKDLMDSDVPAFEDMDEKTIQFLSKLMCRHSQAVKASREVIETQQQLSSAYDSKMQEIKDLTEQLNLSLGSDTLERIEMASKVAQQMNLQEPSLSNFLLGICESQTAHMEHLEKDHALTHHLSSLSRKITQVSKSNAKLKSDLQRLNETAERQQSQQPEVTGKADFICAKSRQYMSDIHRHERLLEEAAYHPDLSHTHLSNRDKEVKELEKKLKNIETKLGSYHGLPPDEGETVSKIQEAKKELSKLQEDFQELLDEDDDKNARQFNLPILKN